MARRADEQSANDRDERPEGLNPDDPGVRMLAHAVAEIDPSRVLLVHCGELPGIRAGATRLILDVRERTPEGEPNDKAAGAGEAKRRSGCSSGCLADHGREDASAPLPFGERRFDAAVVWPRAHLGKDFSEECLATAAQGLREGGRLYCAVRKQKGGKSLARTMRALLGDDAVSVADRDRGYHLWVGERGPGFDAAVATELGTVSYTIEDPALGRLRLLSRPGVFSRRELDGGTRALLTVADAIGRREPDNLPRRVIDLCAGIGPLGLWAAARSSKTKVMAVESNIRACALLRENAIRNELDERVFVVESDGLPVDSPVAKKFAGRTQLVLLNPPTHADPEALLRLLDVRRWLDPSGRLLVVVNRPGRTVELLNRLGATIEGGERDGYFVLSATWPRAAD